MKNSNWTNRVLVIGALAVSAILMHDAQATDTPLNIPGPAKLSLDPNAGIVSALLPTNGGGMFGLLGSRVTSHNVGSPEYLATMRQVATAFTQINCPYFARIDDSVTPRAARLSRDTLIEKIDAGDISYAKSYGTRLPLNTPTAVSVQGDLERTIYTEAIVPVTRFICLRSKPAYLESSAYTPTAEYL